MVTTSTLRLVIAFKAPYLDLEELGREVLRLISELQGSIEVERVERVSEQDIFSGSKPLGGLLVGLLAAEINSKNITSFFRFLGDRLGCKPIELEVEAN